MDAEAQLDNLLLKRFEPNGDDFIFRPNSTAPGVRVTKAEKDEFIEGYKKRQRSQKWTSGTVAFVILILFIAADFQFHLSDSVEKPAMIAAVIGAILIIAFWNSRENRVAIAEFVKDRPEVAPARSKEEARRAYFKNLSWREMGVFAGTLSLAMIGVGFKAHFFIWENRYWIAAFAIYFVAMFSFGAYRKWRWGGSDALATQRRREHDKQ